MDSSHLAGLHQGCWRLRSFAAMDEASANTTFEG